MNRVDQEKTKNLSAGDGFRLHEIPARRFMDQAQYLENVILPQIEKRGGYDTEQFKYFHEIIQSLLFAIMVKDRENNILNKCQQLQQINMILSARNVFLEKELLKYSTVEDLFLTESLSYIEKGVVNRAADLLTKKK